MPPDAETVVELEGELDLARTLIAWRTGYGDPTCRIDGELVRKASRLSTGAATIELEPIHAKGESARVRVAAWGPGAAEAVERAPSFVGAADRPEAFEPAHPELRRLARRARGVRIGRAPSVLDSLVRIVLQQRVRSSDAADSFALLARRHGEKAPGPHDLVLPPTPRVYESLAEHAYPAAGVELRRAEIVRRVAMRARRIEELAVLPLETACARLASFPGIGPWTIGMLAGKALGDADAAPTGDYHMPNLVAWALAGEARADDARMLELLEPFRPHRWRVIGILQRAVRGPPRFGPRMGPPHWVRRRAGT